MRRASQGWRKGAEPVGGEQWQEVQRVQGDSMNSPLWEILALVALFFLFQGEPDVYDKLHALAMSIQPMAQSK